MRLRWPTLATLALCTLLPGCPTTDNYFLDSWSAGAGQALSGSGGSGPSSAGMLLSAGRPEPGPNDGGSTSAGAGPEGGRSGMSAGGLSTAAGSSSAGSTSAGSTSTDAGADGVGGSSEGGSPNGGLGGGGSSGGETSAGGASSGAGSAGSSSYMPDPACPEGVSKGSVCTPASPPLCYKGCGPDNVGYKALTCQGPFYDEPQAACTFPPQQDYSCYKLPASLPAACPLGTPRVGKPCQVAPCTVCFGGPLGAPQYQDTMGMPKQGYCVCSSAGLWTCGSNNGSWPCSSWGPAPFPGPTPTPLPGCH